jgi:putative addiction module component (TIGR02574 family)
MATATTDLLDQAQALPPAQRALLAKALLESLEPADTEADRMLLEECKRRWSACLADPSQAIPAEEVLRELDRELAQP